MSQANIKILFLFYDSKFKDGVYFGSERKKVKQSTHSKYSLNRIDVKKRQEICRNVQELRFTYSHFQFNQYFPKLEKERGKRKKLSFRSSLPEVFYKKGVLKNFAKFTGKQLCQTGQSLFF